jgi:hypothetical protein
MIGMLFMDLVQTTPEAGIRFSALLDFLYLSIVRYSKEHNVRETVSAFAVR